MVAVFFKKGQISGPLGTIVKLVLAIAGFMIIANIAMGFWGDDIEQLEGLCEASVGAQNVFTLNVKGTDVKALPLQCSTMDLKVKGDQEEVMTEISDKVARCWEMFGSGQYDTNMFSNFEIFGDKGGCFTCYNMLIQESSDFKEGKEDMIKPQQFVDFLEEEEYFNTGVSYLDYVQYKAGGPGMIVPLFVGEESGDALPDTAGIGANRAYSIAFGTKTEDCSWCWWATGGGAVAAAGGIAVILAIPSGGSSLAMYGALMAGGGAAGGVGSAVAGASGIVSDKFFEERAIHTIYVVDVTDQDVLNAFESECSVIYN